MVKWLISIVLVCRFFYAQADTTSIFFSLDVPDLDFNATAKIDSLIYYDIINPQQELLIVGYADHLGSNSYNDTLSQQRASGVQAYLETMGIPPGNITLCTGKGEVPRNIELPEGYAIDRRVDIVPIERRPMHKSSVVPKVQTQKAEISKPALRKTFDSFIPEQVQVGQLFVLENIFFYTGRHKVVDESLPELDKLYKILEEALTLEINIEGHVCCVPPSVDALDMDTGEMALSVNRAKYIYTYLIRRGIDSERLSYEGFGKKRPLAMPENTQEAQDMNKRVEIRILKK